MDTDEIMPIIFLAGVIYTWGCLNRGWTSPVDIGGYIVVDIACRRGVHRWCEHETPRSEQGAPTTSPATAPVPTSDVHHGPLREPVTLVQAPTRPVLLDDLTRVEIPFDATSTEKQPGETSIAWTRRMMETGLLKRSEIDEIGAAKFGVHRDTVRRWRRGLGDGKDETDTPTPGGVSK